MHQIGGNLCYKQVSKQVYCRQAQSDVLDNLKEQFCRQQLRLLHLHSQVSSKLKCVFRVSVNAECTYAAIYPQPNHLFTTAHVLQSQSAEIVNKTL